MRVVLLCAGAAAVSGWAARHWLRVVVVDGPSMAPSYADGDRLLAAYGLRLLPIRRGDVVVVRAPSPAWRPEDRWDEAHVSVVKRVTATSGQPRPDGAGVVPGSSVYIEGDAPGSYDSRVFGPLPRAEVVGRVLTRLVRGQPPPGSSSLPRSWPGGARRLTDARQRVVPAGPVRN